MSLRAEAGFIKILILESDTEWRNRLSKFLVSKGYSVIGGADESQGVKQLDKSPDLVIVGIDSAKADTGGMIAFVKSKQFRGFIKNVPILLLTSATDKNLHAELNKLTSDGILVKPFDLEDFGRRIIRHLFLEVRLDCVAPGVPIGFDVYLMVNSKPTLFRKKGDLLTHERVKNLTQHGAKKFFIPVSQKGEYQRALRTVIEGGQLNTDTKTKLLKETAFLQLHEVFTRVEISGAVQETMATVEDIVSFISDDVKAAASLMNLSRHDYYTYNHCVNVAIYSAVLAKKIFGEDRKILMAAGLGGILHDVGIRRIDRSIVHKLDSLTDEETVEMRQHPAYGKEYLDEIQNVPEEAKLIVYQHHENYDGTGYPLGIKDEQIAVLSRLASIADVFDALTMARPQHSGLPPAVALQTMAGMQPGRFDPELFRYFDNASVGKAQVTLSKLFDPCSPRPLYKAN